MARSIEHKATTECDTFGPLSVLVIPKSNPNSDPNEVSPVVISISKKHDEHTDDDSLPLKIYTNQYPKKHNEHTDDFYRGIVSKSPYTK